MSVLDDVRYVLRTLAKNRGFFAVALLTIALGVGANAAVFAVVNAVLLRPLPFHDSDRLVAIHVIDRRSPAERREVSYPNFLDWQRAMRSVEGMTAYGGYPFTLDADGTSERVEAARVSANYFAVLGIRALHGRTLEAADDHPGAEPVMVISDSLWAQLFNRNEAAVGRVVRINGTATTIVGIVPSNFSGPPDMTGIQDVARLWVAIGRFAPTGDLNNRAAPWITPVIARLRPGVTLRAAQAELDLLAADLEQAYPSDNLNRGALLVSFDDQYFGHVRPVLFILFGAVTFVLSIACANLANLLLVRGDARQRELAVRVALGAARARVARLVLVESVTVSILGGGLGLLCAAWLVDVLVALSPVSLPSFVRVSIDGRVLAFTFAMCAVSGIVFGLAPAIIGSRTNVLNGLKLAGRGASSGAPSLRRRLVTVQIAFSLVLVIGAGLMLRTLDRLRAFDPGFRLRGLIAVNVQLPADLFQSRATQRGNDFLRTLLERARAVQGVEQASLTWDIPLIYIWLQTGVRILDRDVDPVLVRRHMASPGYFQTLGVPIIEGRDFTAADDGSTPPVAIISRRMAERYWPNAGALHQRLRYGDRTLEIVGVVGDVQHESLLQQSRDPDMYLSIYQSTLMRGITVAARTSDSSERVAAALHQVVRDLGQGASVFQTRTGEQIFNAQIARERFMGILLMIFSGVALVLTLVGVYAVAAYNVSRQTREIGIRVALGATRADVLRNVLRLEVTSIAQGIALGVVSGLGLAGTLSAFLYEVSPTDPIIFASVAALLGAVAMAACLIPARYATRVDPVVALRAE